ncbi:hypothetical protein D3C87_1362990 [compost metagenome]
MSRLIILILMSLYFGPSAFALGEYQLFNFQVLSELSTQSDQVWAVLVKEKGISGAKQSLKSTKLDPRLVELHALLSQSIESSFFDNSTVGILFSRTFGPSYKANTNSVMSPLLRQVARSLSLGAALKIYQKMDSAFTMVPTNILVTDVINCAIKNCDQSQYKSFNPQLRRPHFNEEMLRLGRLYFYANKIATADYGDPGGFSCENYPDILWSADTLEVLSRIQFSLNDTSKEWEAINNCLLEAEMAKGFRRDAIAPSHVVNFELVKEVALSYLKQIR